MTLLIYSIIVVLCGLLGLVSYVERLYTESGKFLTREFQENIEALEALIEAGQEEGILEESDRALIHSVVEFGDKTVREVMTPRPEIFAVPADTTVEQFTAMLRERPHQRVPIYVGDIDHIQGMV